MFSTRHAKYPEARRITMSGPKAEWGIVFEKPARLPATFAQFPFTPL
jgi:hypothetical protein